MARGQKVSQKSKSAKVTTRIFMTASKPAIPRMDKAIKIQKHKILTVIPCHTPEDGCHIKKTLSDFMLNSRSSQVTSAFLNLDPQLSLCLTKDPKLQSASLCQPHDRSEA